MKNRNLIMKDMETNKTERKEPIAQPEGQHNRQVEEALICSILLSKSAMLKVAPVVKAGMFSDPYLGLIYRAMDELDSEGNTPDIMTVDVKARRLDEAMWEEKKGIASISRAMCECRLEEGAMFYAEEVKRLYMLRLMHALFVKLTGKAGQYATDYGELIEENEREMLALRELSSTGTPACSLVEMAGEVLEMYARREENKSDVNYIRTGIESLDHVIGGFYKGELTVLAGRPGDGKTATAMFMAMEAAMAGKSVCYYSMEMTKLQTMNRIFTGYAGVNSHHLRTGGISREEMYRMTHLMDRLRGWRLSFYYTPANTVENIRAQSTLQKKKGGCDLIIVDYLHLLANKMRPGDTLDQAIGRNIQMLKQIAIELECPVLVLSQMNRENERRADKTHVPELHNLRDSGVIEQVADGVLFLHRPERYGVETDTNGQDTKGLCKVYIQKNRNGEVGVASFRYNDSFTRILNPAKTFRA